MPVDLKKLKKSINRPNYGASILSHIEKFRFKFSSIENAARNTQVYVHMCVYIFVWLCMYVCSHMWSTDC